MISFVQHLICLIYIISSVILMTYGLHGYIMIYLFLRRHRQHRQQYQDEITRYHDLHSPCDYPMVTVQLPIYNEFDVVERLLWSAAEIDYPHDRFEIQVLDDSTDETCNIIDRVAGIINARGIEISVIRRGHRQDYKAGALAHGLPLCKGEYIAIFDADFVIPKNFLKRQVALMHLHPQVACVQGRWEHINRDENWLTRAVSVGIDGHFAAEQGARGYSQLCLNFNGTAGTWRKSAILAAGGWSGDTLTEDLDLSYRAQLAGYTILYDFDVECPAEIPNNIAALKGQQKRWAKGSIETALKLMPVIMSSTQFNWRQKVEAFFHLTHYLIAVLMCVLFALCLPMLLWTPIPQRGWLLGVIWVMISISALAPCVMYTVSGWILHRGWFSFTHFPAMLVVGTGLCLNNAQAVVEALLGRKSAFQRTPKCGSTNTHIRSGYYRVPGKPLLGYLELLAGLYCLISLGVYFMSAKYLFGFFIAAYAAGLTVFGWLTVRPVHA